MNNGLTLGSLFDGSGGFPLAGMMAGITPVWASEVEPFCIRVTTKRIPQMKHCGDISNINGGEVEPVDIITFGSPCQNLSLAGNRSGLNGEKSSMFFEAIRVIREMREATDGKYPRWIVWENVPGALSSSKGEDFRTVLDEIVKIKDSAVYVPMPEKRWETAGEIVGDDYSVAYRILNAQFFGVPQRRRRIFLVADFGGQSAGKILFESEGVFRDFTQERGSWKRAAADAEAGIGAAGAVCCLNDQVAPQRYADAGGGFSRSENVLSGSRMDVTENMTATLRSKANHPPCVMESAGFCTEGSAAARSIGYEKETSPTVRAEKVPAAVALENHPNDSRLKIDASGTIQTLTGRAGTGGGNVPMVMNEREYAATILEDVANPLMATDYKGTQCVFESNQKENPKTLKIRSGCEGGGKGALIQDNKSATLGCNNDQTVFVPKTYGICSNSSNSMKSDNPHSGIYEAETARTIDGNGGNPSCNQGGMAVVALEGNGSRPSHHGNGYSESEIMYTLNTIDRHAVYAIDRAAYNQGKNAQFNISITDDETAQTVVAKGPGAVASFYPQSEDEVSNTPVNETNTDEPRYTVRRLTPLECCRLQGFPDYWCDGLETENPTAADIAEWSEIFETYRKAIGKSSKSKSEKQVIKWLKNPYSDAAMYAMWGNGVALPCVFYVLNGIVNAVK